MEFHTHRIDKSIKREPGFNRSKSLSMYNDPPSIEISLDEFELLALDRLQLLREVENCRVRDLNINDMKQKIDAVS